ncbi:tyrosine-type recombinase/integrase [Hyphococcus sp.]|uniref:tyrosine-type recombinase/integrase n=1 Tax=Hyphococcus sp. TaxID=2038636 RepID=UPI0035C7669F
MNEKHKIMGGKVYVYRRERSRYWQCSTFLDGRNWRTSTKEDSLSRAKDFAEDWYLGLRGKKVLGQLKHEKTFKQAADQFLKEYEVITLGERSPIYIDNTKRRLKNYLIPFFGDKGLSEVTAGLVQEYRVFRQTNSVTRYNCKNENGEPKEYGAPSRSTIHQEIVTLRQVLKTALRHGWLSHLPDLSMPYKTAGKITHRAWFSPDEYKRLYEATRRRAQNPPKKRWKHSCEQLHDYVLFMANTGLRPDEANRLQYRDVTIIEDEETEETILEIEVRGKRGVGYCKSMTGAVRPFQRLVKRNKPKLDDLIFPTFPRELFNTILEEENLKQDREGQRRTAYSLRHTYICLRLMEGADIYQIAKNCRTSVEMIETYYASHIKTSLNAAAINVRRQRKNKAEPVTAQTLLAE